MNSASGNRTVFDTDTAVDTFCFVYYRAGKFCRDPGESSKKRSRVTFSGHVEVCISESVEKIFPGQNFRVSFLIQGHNFYLIFTAGADPADLSLLIGRNKKRIKTYELRFIPLGNVFSGISRRLQREEFEE